MKEKEAQLENLKDDALEEYTRLVHDLEAGMTRKINPTIFDQKRKDGLVITTGFEWNTIKEMLDGKKPSNNWCYIDRDTTDGRYYFNSSNSQSVSFRWSK